MTHRNSKRLALSILSTLLEYIYGWINRLNICRGAKNYHGKWKRLSLYDQYGWRMRQTLLLFKLTSWDLSYVFFYNCLFVNILYVWYSILNCNSINQSYQTKFYFCNLNQTIWLFVIFLNIQVNFLYIYS